MKSPRVRRRWLRYLRGKKSARRLWFLICWSEKFFFLHAAFRMVGDFSDRPSSGPIHARDQYTSGRGERRRATNQNTMKRIHIWAWACVEGSIIHKPSHAAFSVSFVLFPFALLCVTRRAKRISLHVPLMFCFAGNMSMEGDGSATSPPAGFLHFLKEASRTIGLVTHSSLQPSRKKKDFSLYPSFMCSHNMYTPILLSIHA